MSASRNRDRDHAAPRRSRHRIHGNPFTVRGEIPVPDWPAIFGRNAPLALDVGFGGGDFLLGLARLHPEWNCVGVEIRKHFVDDLNRAAAAAGLKNLHAVLANINAHLDVLFAPESLVFVSVNFPDPWFKKRHHKRRVVRPEWLAALLPKLAAGAELHAMTDFLPVAEEMRRVFAAEPRLHSPEGPDAFAEGSTTGIESERERSHVRRGHAVYRLRYVVTSLGR